MAAGCAGVRRLSDFLNSAEDVIEYTANVNHCGFDAAQLDDRAMSPSIASVAEGDVSAQRIRSAP